LCIRKLLMSTATTLINQFQGFEFIPGYIVVVKVDSASYPVVTITNEFLAAIGLTREEVLDKTYFTLLKGITNVNTLAADAIKEAFSFVTHNRRSHDIPILRCDFAAEGVGQNVRYWNLKHAPVLDSSGEVIFIIQSATDVTERVNNESKVKSLKGLEKAYKFFKSAPVVIGYLRKEDYLIELANDGLLNVWQKTSEVIGRPLFEVFPEMEQQGIRGLLNNVMETGKPLFAYAFPITFQRENGLETLYFDFVYQPFYEFDDGVASGIISVGYDVTSQILANKKVAESEKKWKALANTMPVLVWTGDATGSITFLNERWYEFTGLSEQQSLDFGWVRAVHPDDMERCLKVWNDAIIHGSFYEVELRYKSRQNEYRWMLARGVPIKEEGRVKAWYGTSTDIHERKQLESHLEERIKHRTAELEGQKNLLDNILTHSSNGISVSKLIRNESGHPIDSQTILANDAAVRYIGLPKELYLTKPASFFDPDIMRSDYGKACVETLQTGKPFITQYYIDYSARWLEITISKMDDAHLIHIFTDVTPMKEAQLKLERSLDDLKHLNANLEEFAYAASHDLKEPLRKIQFFTSRLREEFRDDLNSKQSELFDRLQKSSTRMENLVNDLLEYSQATRGSFEKTSINLNEMILAVKDDLELEILKRQAKVVADCLPTIRGNQRQVQQMFQNLIGNSLKYSKPDEVPEVRISSKTVKGKEVSLQLPIDALDKTFHLIQVSDNGIGFRQEDAERIFNVFTRLHNTHQSRGSGVGLSIVKRVVEGHEGFVWATSQVDQGSTFHILLPAENPP
jgi:PAS domain S-box-containing protein